VTAVPQADLPLTVTDWETVLVGRFLHVGADGDASPIQSFEVTAETVAAATGIEGATTQEAETAFKAALIADRYLWGALRVGRCRPATATLPNCFAYLAMTLLIDTLLEGSYSDQGQFRDRLRNWLGTRRSLMHLSGVAEMWRALTAWLDVRADAREPYRRLVLPPPRSWTQIGYTRRLSFPTRADVRFLDRVIAGYCRGAPDPPGLIRAVDAAIDRGGASWGMEAAFQQFRTAFRAGTASTDHRFWRLVQRARRDVRQTASEEVVLELGFDEDGRRSISLGRAGDEAGINVVDDLGAAMRSQIVTRSDNLAAAAVRGVAFFRQVGMARWRAQSDPPSGPISAHVAFSSAHARRAREALPALVQSGDWLLTTEPVGPSTVDDLLSRLRMTRLRGEQLLDIALVDGVRVGSSWLGRRDFLPRIEAGDRQIQVSRLAGQDSGLTIAIGDGAFRSDARVEGVYEVAATAAVDGEVPGWSRHVRFVVDAVPHGELAAATYNEPSVKEWIECDLIHAPTPSYNELEWAEEDPASADLLEAIYAAGRSGLAEGELIDLVARGSAGRAERWSLLRSLQESGFLDARYRRRWRGRVWTLGRPTLTVLEGARRLVIVEGALCSALEREFQEVARGMGGRPFRRLGASPWTPAVIGAVDVEPGALVARLGWPVSTKVAEPRTQPPALETSTLVADHHVLASSWDWDRRRFVTGAVGPCAVSLIRWVHPGGRDHDVYRVRSAGHTSSHMTRTAAILTAHIVARVPLFRIEEGMLVRTSREGALPLEFAKSLRRAALAGGGVLDEGGYGYPLGGYDAARISRALPGCIEGAGDCRSASSSMDVLAAARRSGGRTRVRWVNGTMVVGP